MNRRPLSAFLVDDEPMCRADFRITLQAFPEIHLTGEAGTLSAARKFLESRPVDLLFLDLSVGRENGLDLIGHLPHAPMVIAITAHPQHAARGFALDLVDYVLKPVEEPRLRTAVEKAHLRRDAAPLQPGRITLRRRSTKRRPSWSWPRFWARRRWEITCSFTPPAERPSNAPPSST